MKYFIGADPGGSGGIAVLDENGSIVEAKPMMETPTDIYDFLSKYTQDSTCCIERVHGMPGMGGASMFTFGKNFGYLQMALICNKIPFEDPTPQKWMKYYQMKRAKTESKTEWKNRLKAMAQQLHPSHKITLATSDAILIATYCYKINKQSLIDDK